MFRSKSVPASQGSKFTAAVVVTMLTVSLSACAPEPENTDAALPGTGGKGIENQSNESSWGESSRDQYQYTTELPASFPTDLFKLPEQIQIVDTGERPENANQWFLVLKVSDQATADTLWSQIVADNGFTVKDEVTTTEGGKAAVFENAAMSVNALTLPQKDGSVDLSFDLTRIG